MKSLRMGFALVALATAFAACSSGDRGSTFQRAYRQATASDSVFAHGSSHLGPRGLAGASVSLEENELVVVERDDDSYDGRHSKLLKGKAAPVPLTVALPRGGEMRAKLADKLVPIPLKHTDVKAQVAIYLAS